MSEDWTAIAAEVADALGEVGFTATLTPAPVLPASPLDDPLIPTAAGDPVTVVDSGWRNVYGPDMAVRQAHMVTVAASGTVPAVGDTLTMRGKRHHVLRVEPLSPGGVDLLYDLEVRS